MTPNLLIYTNGFEGTWPAIEYGAWLANSMHTRLTLVGVVGSNDADHPVEEIFSRAVSLFQEKSVNYSLELEYGSLEEMVQQRPELRRDQVVESAITDILVVGTFGRPPVRSMIIGRTFRSLMALSKTPILYVPAVRIPIRRVLICLGGLGYAYSVSRLGLNVAQMSQASVTFLTVVPTVDLDYPEARKIRNNWRNLAESDTLAGRGLREGLEQARQMGLQANVTTRHGKIVEQILSELKEGGYDLICMGSQFSSHSLRQIYNPNITADVAEVSQCPILTVRYAVTPSAEPPISSPTRQ